MNTFLLVMVVFGLVLSIINMIISQVVKDTDDSKHAMLWAIACLILSISFELTIIRHSIDDLKRAQSVKVEGP